MTGPEPDETAPITPTPGSDGGGWPSYEPPDAAPRAEPTTGWGQPPAPDPYGAPQPGSQPTAQPTAQPGQPPYPAYSGPGYGHPAYGAYRPPAPNHPQATTAMVLGIISLAGGFLCGLPFLLGPVALIMGHKARKDIASSNGTVGGGGAATAGFVLGIISTVLVVLFIAFLVLVIGLAGAGSAGT